MEVVWFLVSTFIYPILTKDHPHLGIFRGGKVNIGEAPYAVTIWKFRVPICGGSIIANKWILTAAHCVKMGIALNFIGVIVALIAIIVTYFKWSYQYWKKKNVPFFEPTIPYGNMNQKTVSVADQITEFYKVGRKNGWKYFGIYMLDSPKFLVTDLDLLRQIMTKDFKHFSDRSTYHNEKADPLTMNLISSKGQNWKNLRSKLTPSFTSGKMKIMFQTLVDCAEHLEKYLMENALQNEPIDIKSYLIRYGIDVIGCCAFGIECNSFTNPNSPFVYYGQKHFNKSKWTNFKILISRNLPNVCKILGLRTIPKDINDFFMDLVQRTVSYREQNGLVRKDMLQQLINIKNNIESPQDKHEGDVSLTMTEITANSFVFFLAGYETTSTTLTFTLFEMANNQDIQNKVRAEICSVSSKHNNELTYDSLSELKYMEQVIDETLRLHNPVAAINRECIEDYNVPGTDIILEKGTTIIIPTMGIHLDEEYYPNPQQFIPERFSDANKHNSHPYAFIPFGEGPRICIGARFAMMEAKIGLTSILKNFRVKPSSKTKVPLEREINMNAVGSPKGGIWLILEKL